MNTKIYSEHFGIERAEGSGTLELKWKNPFDRTSVQQKWTQLEAIDISIEKWTILRKLFDEGEWVVQSFGTRFCGLCKRNLVPGEVFPECKNCPITITGLGNNGCADTPYVKFMDVYHATTYTKAEHRELLVYYAHAEVKFLKRVREKWISLEQV